MRHLLISAAVAAAFASMAHAQLIGDHVEGTKRQCLYRMPGALNNQSDRRVVEVGFGQACPFQYREPEPERRQRRVVIPGTAVLRLTRRERNQVLCIYRSGSRNYERRLPLGRTCPLTPY